MIVRPAALIALAFVAATGSGCQQSGPEPASPTDDLTSSAQVHQCAPQDGQRIDVNAGTISCAEAYSTAAAYNAQGEKYQHLGAFTCYSGTAQTAPIVLICTSDGVEFSVSGP